MIHRFLKFLLAPLPSHFHITSLSYRRTTKSLIVKSFFDTVPGKSPGSGTRSRGEVVVTISADTSASWFASAPAELVQSQPQRPSAD